MQETGENLLEQAMVIGVAAVVNIRRLHRAIRAGYGPKEAQPGQEREARGQSKGQEQDIFSCVRGLWPSLTTFQPQWASSLACFPLGKVQFL